MKILISAYACEPSKGSEPGAGWNWACAAAHEHEVWLMTRANNRSALEAAIETDPSLKMQVVYLDLPGWARTWKKGGRGLRLYYFLWQLLAARESRRLHKTHEFQMVHHLTFANLWLPALICVVDAPFLLGPVGGGPVVPMRLLPALGLRGTAHELFRHVGRALSRLNPLVRFSWRRAHLILCQNAETQDVLPKRCRAKSIIQSNATVQSALLGSGPRHENRVSHGGYQAICAGRLQPWKGLALAIRAVAVAPGWRLLIIGEGPDRERLARLARKIGVESRVEIRSSCAQEELWDLLLSSDVLLLPSLREDASFIAAEAGALGVPIIAFDRGGPPVLQAAGLPAMDLIKLESVRGAVDGLAHALGSQAGRPWARERAVAVDFSPPATRKKLSSIYQRVVPG